MSALVKVSCYGRFYVLIAHVTFMFINTNSKFSYPHSRSCRGILTNTLQRMNDRWFVLLQRTSCRYMDARITFNHGITVHTTSSWEVAWFRGWQPIYRRRKRICLENCISYAIFFFVYMSFLYVPSISITTCLILNCCNKKWIIKLCFLQIKYICSSFCLDVFFFLLNLFFHVLIFIFSVLLFITLYFSTVFWLFRLFCNVIF